MAGHGTPNPIRNDKRRLERYLKEYQKTELPLAVLCRRYGISRKFAYQLLKENNVPRRNREGAQS